MSSAYSWRSSSVRFARYAGKQRQWPTKRHGVTPV